MIQRATSSFASQKSILTRPISLLAGLGAALVLSACGGGGDDTTPPPPPPPVDTPELMVTMGLPGPDVPSGYSQTVATVKVSNVGKAAATSTDVSISADALLERFQVSACKSDSTATTCPSLGTRMTISNLAPGASLTFDLSGTVKLGTSGPVNVSAEASTNTGTNLSSSKQSVGFKAYTNDVSVKLAGPTASVPAGGSFQYVVTVANSGPDAAKNVALNLTQVSSKTPVLGAMTCVAAGGAVCPSTLMPSAMSLSVLPKDGSLVFTLPYSFNPGETAGLIFAATVEARGDANTGNDSASLITP